MQTSTQEIDFETLVNCILNIEHEIILTNTTQTFYHKVLVYSMNEMICSEEINYATYSIYFITENIKSNDSVLMLTKHQINKLFNSKKVKLSLGSYETMFVELIM